MTVQITQDEKDQITRDTMDRLVYSKGYKEELIALNAKYNPHENVNYTYDASKEVVKNASSKKEPLFSLDKVLV